MAAIAAERQLLFGLLALQIGLIDQGQLVAAFQAWTLDKARPLAEHFIIRGDLDAEQRVGVEAMVALHIKKHGNDVEQSLAAVPAARSIRDGLADLGDPDIGATLGRVGSAHPPTHLDEDDPDRTASLAVGPPTSDGQRFRILRPHARGGLGAVFVALDAELNREVALKQILDRHADDQDSRARFVLEAEVTGRLEHPGVVPVYGLGSYADGRPFYAMRLVKGQSLKEAVEHFHAAGSTGDPRRWNLELRQLLNRFVAVCNVMAYAHSRGVIHRDLKPANILLGPYGETLVVDWGLAKVVGRGEAANPAGAVEATLQPAAASGSSETLPGTALGTPAYMSPEQSEGRLEHVGPLSDVYGLGATLYCLLTGGPPIGETDVGEALRQVQRGEFPPPRAVRPGISQGLEAIVLKAMALKPEGRYPSARALADEIEHWLADEPVSVYREPLTARLTRWGRRHRTLAAGLGALLVTAVAALAISTVLIGREQGRTREKAEDLRRKDYIHRVNLAHAEMLDDNIVRAEDLLEGCPADLRGWEWHYVRRLGHRELWTYRGHFENVLCLAISPDGQWVASGAVPSSGSGDSGPEASEHNRGEVRLWDVETGWERRVFPDLPGTVQAVAISPDGQLVAAGGGFSAPRVEGWLKVWDASSGELIWGPPVPGTMVLGLAFHPNGQSLAVGYGRIGDLKQTGYVRLHRATDGRPLGEAFGKLVGGVNAVAFDHDGRRLAVARLDRIEIWDPETGIRVRPWTGHATRAYCAAFHPHGKRLASGSPDHTINLWDLASGTIVQTFSGHRGPVAAIAFGPGGQQLASASKDKSVRLWDVATGRELAAFHGHSHFVPALAFHPDGRRLLSGSLDGTVKVWDTVTSRPIALRGHSTPVFSVGFGDDGHHVVSKSEDLTTRLWNPDTGEEDRRTIPLSGRDGPPIPINVGGAPPSRSRLSPDGRLLAGVKGRDAVVEVRGTASGTVAFTLKGHTEDIWDVVFSPDGTRLATASHDCTIKLWDTATGLEALTLRGHTAGVYCVAFSPDGKRLASGGLDTLALVWDATPLPEAIFTEAKAHRLVQSRVNEWPRKSELIAQLRADPGLDEPARAAALRIAEQLPQPRLGDIWTIVEIPGRDPRDYQRALQWTEERLRLSSAPDGPTLSELGFAYYRVGRLADAWDTFAHAEPMALNGVDGYAPDREIFRVMILHRQGRRAEARSRLDQFRRQFQEHRPHYFWAGPLLREAEALIDPKSVETATGRRSAHQDGSP